MQKGTGCGRYCYNPSKVYKAPDGMGHSSHHWSYFRGRIGKIRKVFEQES